MSTPQDRITEMMDTMKWSVTEVAGVAGVTPSAVSQWLGNGKTTGRISSVKTAMRLQMASGFSAMWLADGEGPKMVTPVVTTANDWPLELVDPARYAALPASARYAAQAAMLHKIEEAEASYRKPSQTSSAAVQSTASNNSTKSPVIGTPEKRRA